jgi:hypothetical protein
MVPDFRRDDVWTPAFAGVTTQETFYECIRVEVPSGDPKNYRGPLTEFKGQQTIYLNFQRIGRPVHDPDPETGGRIYGYFIQTCWFVNVPESSSKAEWAAGENKAGLAGDHFPRS